MIRLKHGQASNPAGDHHTSDRLPAAGRDRQRRGGVTIGTINARSARQVYAIAILRPLRRSRSDTARTANPSRHSAYEAARTQPRMIVYHDRAVHDRAGRTSPDLQPAERRRPAFARVTYGHGASMLSSASPKRRGGARQAERRGLPSATRDGPGCAGSHEPAHLLSPSVAWRHTSKHRTKPQGLTKGLP